MDIVEMSVRMSDKQTDLARKIRSQIKKVTCFECEGVLFYGDPFVAAMNFAWNNPNGGDFYVWLQDNYKMVKR